MRRRPRPGWRRAPRHTGSAFTPPLNTPDADFWFIFPQMAIVLEAAVVRSPAASAAPPCTTMGGVTEKCHERLDGTRNWPGQSPIRDGAGHSARNGVDLGHWQRLPSGARMVLDPRGEDAGVSRGEGWRQAVARPPPATLSDLQDFLVVAWVVSLPCKAGVPRLTVREAYLAPPPRAGPPLSRASSLARHRMGFKSVFPSHPRVSCPACPIPQPPLLSRIPPQGYA